jgi:hypothetical protein
MKRRHSVDIIQSPTNVGNRPVTSSRCRSVKWHIAPLVVDLLLKADELASAPAQAPLFTDQETRRPAKTLRTFILKRGASALRVTRAALAKVREDHALTEHEVQRFHFDIFGPYERRAITVW